MAGDFDPYYTWLAIPPEEQPPDHYRLLAVRKYEANTDVISNAADQRMTHLRSFQNGKHAALSQKLLNEVSAARLTLLVAERRQAYDEQLRAQEAALAPPAMPPPTTALPLSAAPPLMPIDEPASWLATPLAQPAAVVVNTPLTVVTKPHLHSPASYQSETIKPLAQNPLLWIGLGVVAVCFLGGVTTIVGLVMWSRAPAPVVASKPAVVPVETPVKPTPQKPPPGPVEPVVERIQPAPQPPPVAVGGSTRLDGSTAHPSEAKRAARLTLNNYVEVANSAAATSLGKEFTAEAWVRWRGDANGQVIMGNAPHARGGTANDQASSWQVSVAGRGKGNVKFGEGDAQTAEFALPADGQWHHVAICSNAEGLDLFCDGSRRIVMKFAAPASAERGTNFYLGAPNSMANKSSFSSDVAAFRLTSRVRYKANFSPPMNFANDVGTLALLDFSGTFGNQVQDLSRQGRDGKLATIAWVQLESAMPRNTAIAKATSLSTPLNLIDHLDLKQPKAGSSKLLAHLAITTDRSTPVVIPIQVEVPASYLLEATVTRKEGSDMFGLGILVGGQQTLFEFDAFGSTFSGLDLVAGQRTPSPSYPGAYKGALLPVGEPKKVAVFVYPQRVKVTVSDQSVFQWEGDARSLGMVGNFQPVGPPCLFLASWESSFEVRDLRLRPLDPASSPEIAGVKPRSKPVEPFADKPQYVAPVSAAAEPALPGSETLKKSLAQLHGIMSSEFARATTPGDKNALADRLLHLTRFPMTEPAAQYVLFSEAIRLSCEAGNVSQALYLIDQQGLHFPIPIEETKSDAIKLCGTVARKPVEMRNLSEQALTVADKAVEQEKYSVAETLLSMAISAATKANEPQLRTKAVQRNKEVKELQQAARQVQQARERLKSDPENAKANLALGKYLCFVRSDFETGWGHLAKSDHAQLVALAKVEQTIPKDDVTRHLDLADQWANLAQTSSGDDKEAFLIRAYHWYRTARSRASGLSRTKAEKRCDDIQQVVAADKLDPPPARIVRPLRPLGREAPPGLAQASSSPVVNLLPIIDPRQDTIRGEWMLINGELRCTTMHLVPKIYLPYTPPEEYDIKITFSQPVLRNDVCIIMPRQGKSIAWMLGGTQGIFHFSHDPAKLKDGDEPTKSLHAGAFVPNQKYTTIVQVRKDGVKAYFQGRLAAEYQTDYQDMKVDVWRSVPDANRLAIGCDDPTTFHEIEVIEVTGRGRLLR